MELLAELLANVEWQQFVGVLGIEPRKTLDGLVAQRALRLRLKARQLQVLCSWQICVYTSKVAMKCRAGTADLHHNQVVCATRPATQSS